MTCVKLPPGCLSQRWKGQGGEEVSYRPRAKARGPWRGVASGKQGHRLNSIFQESVAERQKDVFFWEAKMPLSPIPFPQMLHTFIPTMVPSVQRSEQSPFYQTQLWGKPGGAGLRGESQTWASLLRWRTDLNFHFPRTPGSV